MNKELFVWTEAYGCGKILSKCLESFYKYHPNQKIHIFGTPADFKLLPKSNNAEYYDLSSDPNIKELFKSGHAGTAYIFAKVIKEHSDNQNYLAHFDSDLIFRKESISTLQNEIETCHIVGSYRCYKNNLNGRKDLDNLKDVVQTYFFAFDKTKISDYNFNELTAMCLGHYNPLNHPILDFFDPVSFDIQKKVF